MKIITILKTVLDALKDNPQAAGWILLALALVLGFYVVLRILNILGTVVNPKTKPSKDP